MASGLNLSDDRGVMSRRALRLFVAILLPLARVVPGRAADPVLIAAGDIASCTSTGDEATSALLDALPGTIVTLGDTAYQSGTASEFANCYDPTWGRRRADTRPAPGNHDYVTLGASAYYAYFGAAAGDPSRGYYSYDLGSWHLVAINSNCSAVGGCGVGSPQETWLRADLAAHPTNCTLAYWHHPLFSSGSHGAQAYMKPIWNALDEDGADVVLNGHDHIYERFGPQTPSGTADATFGVREFVVGTGGASHYTVNQPLANSEARNTDTYGVLRLTLHASGYDWQFAPEAGHSFTDAGTGACHDLPPAVPQSVGGTTVEPPVGADDDAEANASTSGSKIEWSWGLLVGSVALAAGGIVLAARFARRKRSG